MISSRAIEAIESSDTDELLRVIDGYVAAKEWQDLIELRHRCREAVTRGKQVWGAEEHIRYRLALHAPPAVAGPVVSEGESRFSLGPLPEVAASTHAWSDMVGFMTQGPHRLTFAAERVIRGEGVAGEALELPGRLEEWEPRYPVATYKPDKVETPTPAIPTPAPIELPESAAAVEDLQSEAALADLVEPWTDQSNGRCQVSTAEGDVAAAIRSLGLQSARAADLEPADALAWLAWAAASGGAHGRRRGAAAGRYLAWWVVANLSDLDWPAHPNDVGEAARRLRWAWFDDGAPDTGWVLKVAVQDPAIGLSWAISAVDIV